MFHQARLLLRKGQLRSLSLNTARTTLLTVLVALACCSPHICMSADALFV